ncbi:asparagine synthase [Calothrix sp. NIES-4071]|nr:asparagine synthase [Calothrix sp. NIES-4071]BAZ55507.1 asparagine synthase [Calothrix sp. NIES-4105]
MGSILLDNYHFVGYWGYDSHQELVSLCRKIKKQHHKLLSNTQHSSLSTQYLTWNIVSLSASGMHDFSDAWVRPEDSTLVLGREPFGRVPLYWMQQGQVIWFASQVQLLLPLIQAPEVNINALYGYHCFSYVPTPVTPVSQIHAIEAGYELSWNYNNNKITFLQRKQLFQWQQAPDLIYDETDAVKELQVLLKDAVNRQISDLNDEPVGVCLSGGLDSSIIAALLVQAGVKVKAYTVDFGNAGIPEYPYAEQVAQYLNIPLVKVDASPGNIQKALIPTVKALDLPFGDGVTVPLYLLAQAASQETKVIFNGENGDQLFAGWTNKPLIAAAIYQAQHPDKEESFIRQYLRTFHRLWGYEDIVYQSSVRHLINSSYVEDCLQEALDTQYSDELMHRLRRASLMLKGAQNIQPRATNIAFSQGLKVRSPFCDLPLTQWTFRLSSKLMLQGSCEKYILKRAVDDWLPKQIVWRQKRGMGVPLTSWCLHEFWYKLGDWLNPGILRNEGVFQPDIAAKIVSGEFSAAISGRRVGEVLWLLIMWELWRVHVFGESGKKELNHPFILPRNVWRFYNKCKV